MTLQINGGLDTELHNQAKLTEYLLPHSLPLADYVDFTNSTQSYIRYLKSESCVTLSESISVTVSGCSIHAMPQQWCGREGCGSGRARVTIIHALQMQYLPNPDAHPELESSSAILKNTATIHHTKHTLWLPT